MLSIVARRAFDDRSVRTAAATFVCCWTILAVTAPGIPIVWDETIYFVRGRNIVEWFRVIPDALSKEEIQKYWLFIRHAEGHPAGFILPIALGQWLASGVVEPLTAARLGPITLFSAACAAVAVRLRNTHGMVAAVVAPVTLLTFPRIFSEAHFATQDGQLTAWWLLLWVIQSGAAHGWKETIGFGVVLGFTTATKFTGWIAWLPTVLSQVVHRNAAANRRLLVIVPVALLTFYIVNPPIWHEPLNGLSEHFHRNLDRANTLNISTQFLGSHLRRDESPPLVQHARMARLRHTAADIGARHRGPLAMPREAHSVLSDARASLDYVDGRTRAPWRTSTRRHSSVPAGVWLLVCARGHWRPACVRSHLEHPRDAVEVDAACGGFRRSPGKRRQHRPLLSSDAVALHP